MVFFYFFILLIYSTTNPLLQRVFYVGFILNGHKLIFFCFDRQQLLDIKQRKYCLSVFVIVIVVYSQEHQQKTKKNQSTDVSLNWHKPSTGMEEDGILEGFFLTVTK